MTNESLTLFIPLYGKAMMSREGFLPDKWAEEIVSTVDFDFTKVDQSRKLAIYMAMRARYFDMIARNFAKAQPGSPIIQLGVGLDSRVKRVPCGNPWYDLDFPDVIDLRRTYFPEDDRYHLIAAPALPADWLDQLPDGAPTALVLMEGLSMYLSEEDMRSLLRALGERYEDVLVVFDAYSRAAAKLSALKNPVNAVKAKIDFAMDDPQKLIRDLPGWGFEVNDIIRPEEIDRLKGLDRLRFRFMGRFGSGFYRIYGYHYNR